MVYGCLYDMVVGLAWLGKGRGQTKDRTKAEDDKSGSGGAGRGRAYVARSIVSWRAVCCTRPQCNIAINSQ